jgi:hypothetical protein
VALTTVGRRSSPAPAELFSSDDGAMLYQVRAVLPSKHLVQRVQRARLQRAADPSS